MSRRRTSQQTIDSKAVVMATGMVLLVTVSAVLVVVWLGVLLLAALIGAASLCE